MYLNKDKVVIYIKSQRQQTLLSEKVIVVPRRSRGQQKPLAMYIFLQIFLLKILLVLIIEYRMSQSLKLSKKQKKNFQIMLIKIIYITFSLRCRCLAKMLTNVY